MKKSLLIVGIMSLVAAFDATSLKAESVDSPLSALTSDSSEAFLPAPTRAKVNASHLQSRALRIGARKKKTKTTPSPFVGSWYTSLKQVQNTCAGALPKALKIGLKIDDKLVASDIFDGSPFFKGTILAANKIGFARARTANGCTQTQTYVLGNVAGNSGFSALKSETKCGVNSCLTLYSGPSSKK